MEKENLYELSNEAQEAAKRTAWPIESLRDTYAFGYETAKDIYQIRIASLEAQLAEANKKLSWYQSGEIHTCHAECQRPFCVLHKQLESARGVIEFYGDKLNWRDEADSGVKAFGPYKDHKAWTDCGYEHDWENLHDEGDKARKWLEENKNGN